MGKNWDKFVLLTWKNWTLQRRHPIQTVIEILIPAVFCILIVLMRNLRESESYPDKFFTPFELDSFSPDTTYNSIYWSPCDNTALRSIMNNVSDNMNLSVDCYDNSQALEIGIWENMTNILAGIDFGDSLAGANDLDKNLTVTLRFPSELRVSAGTWLTNQIFPSFQTAGPRSVDENTGGAPGYFGEGFLTLQYYISMEIIKYQSDDDSDIPQVLMQRFPYPAWVEDSMQEGLQTLVGLIFVLGFVYTCINTVKAIATEKEMQLKEAMKIMGLPNWLHWTAWFLKIFALLLFSTILIVLILTIPWYPGTGYSVFTLSNPFLVFIFLILYACATITFCFAISALFSKANTAIVMAGLLWFLTYSIFTLINISDDMSLAVKVLTCLASNAAMAFGLQVVLKREGAEEGLSWSNMFTPISSEDNLTMGVVMIMLIVDTFLYLLIAMYLEAVFPGEYGVPKKWYFLFTPSYWSKNQDHAEIGNIGNLESDVYEKEPTNLNIGIQINKLTKVFGGNKAAVRNLSFNMFENQVTVLLGHNGAGKTTTMSMLTGMIPPTAGTVTVNGYDIRNNLSQVRDSLGLCPQHNVLFNDLTVEEHLYFFSKLKGLSKSEINQEIDTYIKLLDLEPKRKAKSTTLSGGMKRKLSVAIAMCGKSKVCMLDEPTAGMDPAARRALWNMITEQKKDRTILLSTHFMDEADLLGDRIAIMAGGQLQCYGSSFFLKKRYGAGYQLIMDKSKECKVDGVTSLLKEYIPNIKIKNDVGSELSYDLAEDQSAIFEQMLNNLENNSQRLGINSYGISLTTMEDVFMKVGADHGQEEIYNGGKTHDMDLEESYNIYSSRVNITEKEHVSGASLWMNQFRAMIIKKSYTTFRNWILLLVQNIIPVLFLFMALLVSRLTGNSDELPSLNISLDLFDDPVTVVTSEQSSNNPFYNQYLDILNGEGRETLNWSSQNMTEIMMNLTTMIPSEVRKRYIIGATFNEDSILAWFNNDPYHSPPVALQYSMNAILQQKINADHKIQFINHPLPSSSESQFSQMIGITSAGSQIGFNLAFSMAFVTSFYILFYIRERASKSKHLQFVSGAKVSTFWIAATLCDFVTFLLNILFIIIILVCFQEDGFSSAAELGIVFLILFVFILATLPLTYLASYLFDVPSSGYTKLTLLKVFLGSALFNVIQAFSSSSGNLETIGNNLDQVLVIVPHYSLASAFAAMGNIHTTVSLCDQISSMNVSACLAYADCCDVNENYFNMDTGIGGNLRTMFVVALVSYIILLMIEFRVFDVLIHFCRKSKVTALSTEDTDDNDVLKEKRKIRSGEIQPSDYVVVLKNLTKHYGKFLAVNQTCLGIKSYECFGLLGINGAGKTTTFKMMTGDVMMSQGDGWIQNLSLKTEMKQIHKHIGYCPQFDALLEDLTMKETLTIYCLLRGIPYDECSYMCLKLAKDFDFTRHLNKLVKNLSGGNKRKLSSAIALIGNPSVVFLDEPTAGMDPATKRNLWNTLCKIRDSGKCLVLTSHSMEECEALCTRLAIMVNGAFKCLGSTQHLKNKFAQGYMLVVKVKKSASDVGYTNEELEPVKKLVQSNFPSAVLRESHQELLTYFIPDMSLSWSKMFGIMERGKREIENLEDYSLGQSSLEQVFLLFTKQQREAEE